MKTLNNNIKKLIEKYIIFFENNFFIYFIAILLTSYFMSPYYLDKINTIFIRIIFVIVNIFNSFYEAIVLFFTASSIIYIFKKGEKKQKLITVITLFIGLITYFNSLLTNPYFFNNYDQIYTISIFILGIMTYNCLDIIIKRVDKKIVINKFIKFIKTITVIVVLNFIFAFLTDSFFTSYLRPKRGMSGWFSTTNEVGHMLVFTLSILFYNYFKKENIKSYVFIIINILGLITVGTKATYMGMYLIVFLGFLTGVIKLFQNNGNIKTKKVLIPIFVTLIVLISVNSHLPGYYNINYSYKTAEKNMTKEEREELKEERESKIATQMLFSNRDKNVKMMFDRYKEKPLKEKFLGMSTEYSKTNILFAEMDMFDYLFKFGIVGVLLYSYIIISTFVIILKNYIKNKKIENYFLLLPVVLGILLSLFIGHVMLCAYIQVLYVSILMINKISIERG